MPWAVYATAAAAILTAVYTAFLFAQARGRDFWQSPMLPFHMLTHAFVAGAAMSILLGAVGLAKTGNFAAWVLLISLGTNLLILLAELTVAHPTADAKATVALILKGPYRGRFWWAVMTGNVIPMLLLMTASPSVPVAVVLALLVLHGIYETEKIWVEAPQRVALS